jgi:hypothetical protein
VSPPRLCDVRIDLLGFAVSCVVYTGDNGVCLALWAFVTLLWLLIKLVVILTKIQISSSLLTSFLNTNIA